jgi:two-component system, cell cycle response regulator
MRIFVAEDETVSRCLLAHALRKMGHTVLLANDGEEAWQQYQEEPVEVIFTDWMMPGLSGLELCQRIRSQDTAAHYPYIVLITALSDCQHFVTGMQHGADDYLVKPVKFEELEACLVAAERVTSLHRRLSEQNQELERLNRELHRQSRCDALTGLYNRLKLREDIDAFSAESIAAPSEPLYVCLGDVDYFKLLNDTQGHLYGDEVLKRLGEAFYRLSANDAEESASFPNADFDTPRVTAYRYGGEEFCFVLRGGTTDSAQRFLQCVQQEVAALALSHTANSAVNSAGYVTLSLGLAEVSSLLENDDNSSSRRALQISHALKTADAALYQAKLAGRNRFCIASSGGCLAELTAA